MPYKDALKNKECKRQWYLDNRDRVLKEAKISYQNNAVLKRKQSKEYRKNNILKIKDRYEKKKLEDIEQVLTRRDKNKEEAILSNGKNAACFDFHHINPNEKIYNPSTALRLSKEKRDMELSKCLLICANCHRLIHAKRNDK